MMKALFRFTTFLAVVFILAALADFAMAIQGNYIHKQETLDRGRGMTDEEITAFLNEGRDPNAEPDLTHPLLHDLTLPTQQEQLDGHFKKMRGIGVHPKDQTRSEHQWTHIEGQGGRDFRLHLRDHPR